ncbi:hypothetical protein SAMN05192560_0691 [Methylobacillus rhizosphaerae]|uniref:Uncharacterized protein n=1 Tax=Methylobacillus rhizosphaerae TaxID=551994 RepID=A0A238YKB9_9PROT|nr:hypothetical protein [Methylobacillus rhizosphaerae]SNR71696.1 hypothetical protein SAMN05192560_0691 [Methylobacillus rhizosphaerae]
MKICLVLVAGILFTACAGAVAGQDARAVRIYNTSGVNSLEVGHDGTLPYSRLRMQAAQYFQHVLQSQSDIPHTRYQLAMLANDGEGDTTARAYASSVVEAYAPTAAMLWLGVKSAHQNGNNDGGGFGYGAQLRKHLPHSEQTERLLSGQLR